MLEVWLDVASRAMRFLAGLQPLLVHCLMVRPAVNGAWLAGGSGGDGGVGDGGGPGGGAGPTPPHHLALCPLSHGPMHWPDDWQPGFMLQWPQLQLASHA